MLRWFRSGLLAFAFVVSSVTLSARDAGLPVLPVTLAWDANTEPTVIGYRVYVGTAPSVYTETFDAGYTTSFTYRTGIAGQRYYFAVAAYSAGPLEGTRSSEVSTVVASAGEPSGVGGGGLPGEGIVLEPASVNGHTVSLTWRPEVSLDLIEYLVEVGSMPGGSDLYNAPVGTQTSVSASVASGTYFARIRARTPGDSSVVSNEVWFTVGPGSCHVLPQTPREPSGSVADGVATLQWKHAGGATSFIVQAGSAAGRSDLYNGDVGNTRSVSANVPAGIPIYARVIAVNACGPSAASDEVRLQ